MTAILEAAIEYQKAGLWMLPLKPRGKLPLIKWKDRADRKPDKDEIREWFTRWPDANIGCLTGKYSGVDVLDIDSQDALESFSAIVGNPYETCYQETGKGYHFFFENNGNNIKNAAALGGIPGIDVRTTGGIIVLSPSVHPSGRVYAWGSDGMIDSETGFDEVNRWPSDIIEWIEKKCAHIGSCEYAEESDMSQAFIIAQSRGFDMHQFIDLNDIHVIRAVALKSEADTQIDRAGFLFVLERCLFADGHESGTSTKGEASIGITSTGMLFYQCFHGSCHGKKWSDVADHFGYSEPQVEIMTAEDVEDEMKSRTLEIPSYFFENKGLITMGMQAAAELSSLDLVQYTFPNVIMIISRCLAGKIRFKGVHPSCFFVKIGKTSTGKTQTDRALRKLLTPYFLTAVPNGTLGEMRNEFYGVTDFASGPGFMRSMSNDGNRLIMMDEITFMFSNAIGGKADPINQGKTAAILELSTASGDRMEKVYSDTAKNIVVENAIINLIGNATPLVFKALTLDDMQSGLIQRFDFFAYDGKIPYRRNLSEVSTDICDSFARSVYDLFSVQKPYADGKTDLRFDKPVNIGIDPDAATIMDNFSRDNVDTLNSESDDGISGIIARKYDASLKYALIHAGATRQPGAIFDPLHTADIEYGIAFAEMLSDWKIKILTQNISAGAFDMTCKAIVEAAKLAVKAGKGPTWKALCSRKKQLCNLTPKEIKDALEICSKRREILIDQSGRVEKYLPVKTK